MRLCAIVTVAFAASNSAAMGLPTIFDRPMMMADSPDRSSPSSRLIISMQPAGVHGTKASSVSPVLSLPTLT